MLPIIVLKSSEKVVCVGEKSLKVSKQCLMVLYHFLGESRDYVLFLLFLIILSFILSII